MIILDREYHIIGLLWTEYFLKFDILQTSFIKFSYYHLYIWSCIWYQILAADIKIMIKIPIKILNLESLVEILNYYYYYFKDTVPLVNQELTKSQVLVQYATSVITFCTIFLIKSVPQTWVVYMNFIIQEGNLYML